MVELILLDPEQRDGVVELAYIDLSAGKRRVTV